jgi:hypothetical protein
LPRERRQKCVWLMRGEASAANSHPIATTSLDIAA